MNTATAATPVRDYKAEIISLLTQWSEGRNLPMDNSFGICFNLQDRMLLDWVDGMSAFMYRLVDVMSAGGPKHSGSTTSPVPDSDTFCCEWYDSQEGRDRRELCGYIATKLAPMTWDEIVEYVRANKQ